MVSYINRLRDGQIDEEQKRRAEIRSAPCYDRARRSLGFIRWRCHFSGAECNARCDRRDGGLLRLRFCLADPPSSIDGSSASGSSTN